jgi:hypothetical protein
MMPAVVLVLPTHPTARDMNDSLKKKGVSDGTGE